MADSEKLYVQSPLVVWVETFKANDGHPLEYQDLVDGVFLNDVMQQIDTRSAYDNVNRCVEDVSVRIHNWDILVKNIREFYTDVLQQLLVIRLPNVSVICREPGKEVSFVEIRKALLLILGCAVQCEQKETFIDKIMSMDITAQTEIAENIKEVTDDCETILPIQRPESTVSSSSYIDKMFCHLYRLIQERDECAELALELGQERDFYMSQAEGRLIVDAPQISPDRHHVALELAECKANLRQLRQELEDRQERLSDIKDELQESLSVSAQLKNENSMLVQEARATRLLRDELDIMKEKASKVDLYEKEILKYKERLNEFEFYKARTAELREDNAILEETKAMLEDQLTNSRKRIETVAELESELGRYRQQIEELSKDRESDREKIEYLTQEHAQLEFQRKTSKNESASLETELSAARSRIGDIGYTLSEQLSETSHTRILRLELENQRLASVVAETKNNALAQNAEICLELEKENQRLLKKIEKIQSSAHESSQQVIQIDNELSSVREERDKLLKSLDTANDKSEQHIRELEREIEQLSQALHQLRERSEKSNDLKVKDLERENKRLHETVAGKNSQLNKLEFENRQLHRSSHQLQEVTHRVQELEQENQLLEKENAELHHKVTTLQHTSDKLEAIEQENSDMGVENRKLQKTVETLQGAVQRKEQIEQDHMCLTLEHQRLQRMMETLKVESDRALELESEKDDLNKELHQVRKLLDGQKTQKLKQDQMEFEIIDMANENQRLQKSLEVTMRRLHQLEEDNMDIETDNEKISKELETLKVTVKRLECRDTEASHLEVEVQRLQKDKTSLEKENRKLKQVSELKESSLDDINAKFMSLNQEYKCVKQSVEKMKETCYKVKDMEKENKELLQELNTDRRTLAALREDLVNEKIRSQELSNELDQLTGELEKVGIDTEKLTKAEQTNDANRYKALETMIQETLKKSGELKEEKIRALETRLDESKSRNFKLQEDLIVAKREREVLKQRLEEEEIVVKDAVANRKDGNQSYVKSASSNATKEILQLKDHLVELERQNATFLAETDNLRSNNQNINEQCYKLDTQLSNLNFQHATLQGHYSSLREQHAKLQVEYTTLQAQISSGLSQQGILKNQLSHMEAEHENIIHKYESLLNTHQSLVSDHESLQHLHEQLTAQYESLVSEHGSLKSLNKSVKIEMKDLQDQIGVLLQGKDDVNKLQDEVEKERDRMKREVLLLGNMQSDYQVLRVDHSRLRSAFDKLSNDYSDVLSSHKQVKTDCNNLQLRVTELQGELCEARESVSVADMEFEKLENRMETIYHINERIENENQALLMQIKQLLNQNQELLTQALNSKDHFAEEEKAYLEKLSELRRQKERLEEKIMEHYKNRLSPKKKGLGALIARKARGIISRGPRHSKSRNNLSELLDNSSQGSGSTEPVNDGHQLLDDITSLLSTTSSFSTGAKSTEDVNTSANTGVLHRSGHLKTINDVETCPTKMVTTPKPGSKIKVISPPVSETLTVREVNKSMLNTADSNLSDDSCADELKSLEQVHRRLYNDSGSRGSSEHSSTGSGRIHHQWQVNQQYSHDGMYLGHLDVSDAMSVSLMSPTVSESHPSEISIGSDNDSNSITLSGVHSDQVITPFSKSHTRSNVEGRVSSSRLGERGFNHLQTTASDLNTGRRRLSENSHRNSGYELLSSASSTIGDEQAYFLRSQTHLPTSQTSSSHFVHHPPSHSPYHPPNTYKRQSQEQRPAPTYPPPPIPAKEQLNSMTILAPDADESPYTHYSRPYDQSFSNTDHHDNTWHKDGRNSVSSSDSERNRSQIMYGENISVSYQQSQPGMSFNNQHQQIDSSAIMIDYTAPSSQVNDLPDQNKPIRHVRPASAMDQSSHIRSVNSRPPVDVRSRQHLHQGRLSDHGSRRDSSGHLLDTNNVNNSSSKYNQPHVTERPKSVPPHLFYKTEDKHYGQERDIYGSPTHRNRNVVEIVSKDILRETPDRRDPRETKSFSNIGFIREPIRSSHQSGSQSHESQSSRQSHQQQHLPYQQQHYIYANNIDHSSVSSNRQIGNWSSPSLPMSSLPLQQPHYSPQTASYPTRNLTGSRSNSVDQFYLHKLDSSPLVHQEEDFYISGQQQSRLGYDPDMKRHAASRSLVRSQSSRAYVPGTASTSGIAHGVSYGQHRTPERWSLQADQHDKDDQNGSSDCQHDPLFHPSDHPLESSSNFQRSTYVADRNCRQYRGNNESKDIAVPSLPEGSSYSQCQKLSNSSNHTIPPQRNHSHNSSQYHKANGPSSSDFVSHEPSSHFGGSHLHQSSQEHDVKPQGKPSSNHQHNIPSNIPTTAELTSPDHKTGSSPSHHTTSQLSPQPKHVPPKSEKELEAEQTTNTNAIWYEYGCV